MNEREIFNAASRKENAVDQAAFLDEACAGNADLRQRVWSLLGERDRLGSFLESSRPVATVDDALRERPGTVIGPYKLLQQIGEGGMGTVFMAEQTQPVKRKVALKVIKPGMDSCQVIARFEAERQALAMMDHVNIARVLDAGATESGRPYFVMELVHGVPITKYCDDNHLTPRQRLELFVPVCQAIQHAHQKGIIHRDVKPSNVMVTLYDGKPVPKVIDFGVAKATEQRLTERTLFTQYGTLVGTLEYMSPEQAGMSALGVDTRSDIYSLGVLLYELLTGSTPLSHKRVREAAYGEILRMIKEEEPPKPSTRLSDSGEALASISAQRHMEPAKLTKLVRGELDWIVMKTLEKDRNRRYETANGFAADVQRYLNDEPVLACPPSAGYRFNKLMRRHKGPMMTAALVLLALVVGLIGLGWGLVQADQGRRLAERREQEAQVATLAEAQAKQEALEQQARAETAAAAERRAKHEALDQQAKAEAATAAERQARLVAEKAELRAETARYAIQIGLAHREWQENNLLRAKEVLAECRVDLRGWEYDYLHSLCQQRMMSLQADSGGVTSVAFSPDGKRLATAGMGLGSGKPGQVKVWDVVTGEETFVLKRKDDAGAVACVAFSPDGKRLAGGSRANPQKPGTPGQVTVWELSTGQEVFTLKGHSDGIASVTFSPDGMWLASASSDGVRLWNTASGEEVFTFTGLNSVAFRPDGKLLAIGSLDGTVKLWDMVAGREVLTLKGHTLGVTSVAFRPDGKHLASGSLDGTVKLWDVATGRDVFTLKGHTGRVWRVAFSPDGKRLASASDDQTVKVWDTATGQEALTLKGHTEGVMILSMAFSPDGKRLAIGLLDGTARLWDVATGREVLTLKGHIGGVSSVAFSADGKRLASGSFDKMVNLWNLDMDESRTLQGHMDMVTSVAFSPDSKQMASASLDRSVKVWDVDTGEEAFTLNGHMGVTSVAFSPDGKRLASGGGGENDKTGFFGAIELWDLQTRLLALTLKGHRQGVVSVAFSPDGQRLASASLGYGKTGGGMIKLWDLPMGREALPLRGPVEFPMSVAYSSDGKRLASAGGGFFSQEVKIWDTATGKAVLTLQKQRPAFQRAPVITSVSFSPDGRHLASARRGSGNVIGDGPPGEITIWDLRTGQEVLSLKGHTGDVLSVVYHPEGRRLATASDDKTVKVWDATTGQEVLSLKVHTAWVSSVAFSPDGNHLASAGWVDRTLRIWSGAATVRQENH